MQRLARVTFARSHPRASEMAPFARGGLDGLLWVFDQDDSSEHWLRFLAKARELGSEPAIGVRFSPAEISSATWCHWLAQSHQGYPQPDDDFGYMRTTYDLTEACPVCNVGVRQVAPFRMRAEPRWGRRSILQMYWVYDAWFVTPDAYQRVFEPFGIACMEVLRKSGNPLETVVQLVVGPTTPLTEQRTEGEVCAACGRLKLHAALSDFAPPPARTPVSPLVYSEGWYGSGGLAFRATLIRGDLVAAIKGAGLRGADFHPCRA